MSTTDLFWEPLVGEKVKIKDSAMWRHGGITGSDGLHTVVMDAGTIEQNGESHRMFWITRDGPVRTWTDKKGRVRVERPTSQIPISLEEIEPCTAAVELRAAAC